MLGELWSLMGVNAQKLIRDVISLPIVVFRVCAGIRLPLGASNRGRYFLAVPPMYVCVCANMHTRWKIPPFRPSYRNFFLRCFNSVQFSLGLSARGRCY